MKQPQTLVCCHWEWSSRLREMSRRYVSRANGASRLILSTGSAQIKLILNVDRVPNAVKAIHIFIKNAEEAKTHSVDNAPSVNQVITSERNVRYVMILNVLAVPLVQIVTGVRPVLTSPFITAL